MSEGKKELDRLVEKVARGRCFTFIARYHLQRIESKYGAEVFDYYRVDEKKHIEDKAYLQELKTTYHLGGSSKELVSRMIAVSKKVYIGKWIAEICATFVLVMALIAFLAYLFRQ